MSDRKPARSRLPVLAQLCKLIPPHLNAKLAREHGVDAKARAFTPWSHVVSLLFAQLGHHAARLKDGEIDLFDKAYVDFAHL